MEAKVSVVVPVYNVEKYLKKCLNSLVFQSLPELEIIVVNDGSPDGSQKIIKQYQAKYPEQIKAFTKENGGLSDARNFGIEKATGEYIAFLDSDDFADLDMYERLYKKATEGNFDLAVCDIRYVFPDGRVREVPSGFPPECRTREEMKSSFTTFYPAVWNKIYKRSLLEKSKVRFKKGAWFEDVEFLHRLYPFIESCGALPFSFINYVQRGDSVTALHDKRLFDYLSNWESILAFYRENGFFEFYRKELEFSCVRYLFATFIKRCIYFEKADFDHAVARAISFVKTNFPHYKQNPYLLKNGLKGLYLLTFSPFTAGLLRKKGK